MCEYQETSLKQIRSNYRFTQKEFASLLGMPLSTYRTYETNDNKKDSMAYKYLMLTSHDIVKEAYKSKTFTIDELKDRFQDIFAEYNLKEVYLYGGYQNGPELDYATINIYVDPCPNGLDYFAMQTELEVRVFKHIKIEYDNDYEDNSELILSIKANGIKIYG